jgi:hypothetical protein
VLVERFTTRRDKQKAIEYYQLFLTSAYFQLSLTVKVFVGHKIVGVRGPLDLRELKLRSVHIANVVDIKQ